MCQGAVGVSGDDDKLQFWVQVMCQLCQLHDFTSFARIGDEQQQVILLEDAEVTMLCFAGVQENGRNTGRAEGGSDVHGYLSCLAHARSYQFPFFAVHLFYDEFYSSFISVRHWNVQYGLCLFLQKLLNGCNHT